MGEPLTKEEWRKKYGGLTCPGGKAWASAPTYDPDAAKPAEQTPQAGDVELMQGDRVQAFDLQGAKELNGLTGMVINKTASGRYTVRFDGGKGEKALKSANLAKLPPSNTPLGMTTSSGGGVAAVPLP